MDFIIQVLLGILLLSKATHQTKCVSPQIFPPKSLIFQETLEEEFIVGETFNSSASWKFTTKSGNFLTLKINWNHDRIHKKDCVDEGGPAIIVQTYDGRHVITETACYNRIGVLNYSLTSLNYIVVKYCNGIAGYSLKFTISAVAAGYVRLTKGNRKVYQLQYANVEQWIAMLHTEKDAIFLQGREVEVKRSDRGNCKKGFLKVKSDDETLQEICNIDESYPQEFKLTANRKNVNISFKRAKLTLVAELVSKTVTIEGRNLPLATSSLPAAIADPQTDTTPAANVDKSNIFLYIGLALAIIIFIALVIFVMSVFRHRKYKKAKKESKKQSEGSELTACTRPRDDGIPGTAVHSINNAMYDKVANDDANNGVPAASQIMQSSSTFTEDTMIQNKRRLRLQQLADKYTDVEFPAKQNRPTNGHQFRRPQPPQPGQHDPRATFNHTRLPLPPPLKITKNPLAQAYKYETIDPPFSSQNLVPPAYCSIDNEHVNFLERDFEFSSIESIPIGEYGSAGGLTGQKLGKQAAPYLSVESFVDSEHSDDFGENNNRENDTPLIESANSSPTVSRDGYLSSLSNIDENVRKSTQNIYVSPNKASSESLKNYFKKPVPNPGIDMNATSMPSLLDEDDQIINAHPPKVARRKQHPTEKTNFSTETSKVTGLNVLNKPPKSGRYKSPRPSAPDIFIKCAAYTSTDDIAQIRHHLQNVASRNQHNSLTSGAPSDRKEGFALYDSPKSSPSSSMNSLLDQHKFYDTPRPSLPHIFPEEMKLLNKQNNP